MGVDIKFLSPCCLMEDYLDLEDGRYECDHCGETFRSWDLVKEFVEYKEEESCGR